ncbi:MAG: recombination protein RecR [Chloroflexi bacterium]|jgi:recombination protein RecR|nr:recombination protein RecR [Chloroflexota bacterium]
MAASNSLPPSLSRLIEALTQLPGIGPKTASRLAFYLWRAPAETALTLAEALRDLKANTRLCSVCFNITESDPCPICADSAREHDLICVVEEPMDVAAIERARAYRGVYHVLHGVLSPINGIGPDDLRIDALVDRVRRAAERGQPIREVILATNPTVEGEMTAAFIQRKLAGLGVSVTRLARGLPAGGDLEYADEVTLSRALEGRQRL